MTDEGQRYMRDIYDHLIRISDLVDGYRDLLSGVMDTHLSTVSNRLNVVMKQLTIIATVFLPLSFLTGFFGQNFSFLVGHITGRLAVLRVRDRVRGASPPSPSSTCSASGGGSGGRAAEHVPTRGQHRPCRRARTAPTVPSGRTAATAPRRRRGPSPRRGSCPIEATEAADPMEPIDSTEPTEPKDRIDPVELIDRSERSGGEDRPPGASGSVQPRMVQSARRRAGVPLTGDHRVAGRVEHVPAAPGVGQGLAGGLARRLVRGPEVERPAVVGDLGGPVGAGAGAEEPGLDAGSGPGAATPAGRTAGGHWTAQMS